jgi:hypothetical protein
MTRRAFEHLKSSCDAEALLHRAGLTLQGIEDPQARIGAESQIAFLKLASEALDDPLLGFHLAESFEPRELGLLYYVQASSANLGEALARVARYSSVAHEGLAAKCVRGYALTFRIDYVGVPRHTDRHQMEFLTTALVRICRHLTNTHLRPIRVRLAHPRCAASAALEEFLGQSIEFGAGHDEMTYVGAAADLPVMSADPYLSQALVRYWEDALGRRGSAQRPLRAAVENAILPLLPRRGLAGSRRPCILARGPWRAGSPARTSPSRRCSTSFGRTLPRAISMTPHSRSRTLPGSWASRKRARSRTPSSAGPARRPRSGEGRNGCRPELPRAASRRARHRSAPVVQPLRLLDELAHGLDGILDLGEAAAVHQLAPAVAE